MSRNVGPGSREVPEFFVVPGTVVKRVLESNRKTMIDIVEQAYLAHESSNTVNPDSYFLRFPDAPSNRIIALPAAITGENSVSGIKWIASYPSNVEHSIPRASAILVLNDFTTGYPFAVLEAALISACRTASSAVLAARYLCGPERAKTISFIGCGVISRAIADTFLSDDWEPDGVKIFDLDERSASALKNHILSRSSLDVRVYSDVQNVLDADVVVLATTALVPYITEIDTFRAGQVVLNVSLRDIGVDIISQSHNFCDDVEHCMKADTSVHLTEQYVGHRNFVNGTLAQVVRNDVSVTWDKPIVFSPFGMGILDLAVGKFVFDEAVRSSGAIKVPGFFGEEERW